MRNRAGIILIEGDKLALIERYRGGLHYFIFPGGGIDEGESEEQAAIREAYEELGIVVEIKQRVAELTRLSGKQVYFLVRHIEGEFGTGTGEEYGEYDPKYGSYLPLWMPIDEITKKNVLPRELAEFVVMSHQRGWSPEPAIIIEEK
ncbi:MAG: NUDIX domain-containing protein [Anaerolineales bacterium]